MLILSRKVGESIRIRGDILVTLVRITGDKAKIGIDAPEELEILRTELVERNQREQRLESEQ